MNPFRRPLRILAVAGKETVEILRRPSALVSVVAGPVLILGLFGLGYLGQPPLRAAIVIPPDSGLATDPTAYSSLASDKITIIGVTPDAETARAQLRAGAADIVVIAPADAEAQLSQGLQAVMTVEYDTVSPYRAFVAQTAANQLVAAVNSEVIATAAKRIGDKAAEAGQSLPPELNPEVIAAPTRANVTDLSPSVPNIVAFYGIMVLALIVQHTAITVSALSMLHDRRRGMFDLFRMSPIASGDLLTGKYAAFALLGTVVALVVLAVLVFGFGVPFLSGPAVVVGAVALLVLASIGIGIVVALVSDSDRQAVQVALLVLLASVFFSGLALDLDQFSAPVRAVSALLPVTQAGSLLQDLMLRGETTQAWRAVVLAAMAGILFVAGWLVLRRQLHRPA
jgi:ABC-2 type transport system permease protein